MIASVAELAILMHFEKYAGDYGKPLFTGARGARLRTYTREVGILAPLALNLLGSILPLPKPVDAVRGTISSVLTLVGGYILRDSMIEAGKASVRDPHAAFVQPK